MARPQKGERNADDVAALEVDEEGLIQLAAERGITISRRPDASPLAVLGITVAT